MALLTVSGLSKTERSKFIVKDIHFSQQRFQKIAIAGETGSGKTTLLKMIAGLIQPDVGVILFENERVIGPLDKLIPGHPRIACLSQHFELRNNYRVEEELEAVNKLTEKEAKDLYAVCRIEHLLKRRTDQLSGGERQRIVLARLLSTSPGLLLLDEPFSNLDAIHTNITRSVIHDIGEKLKISCIMVSHDASDVLSWADSILVMKDGALIQQGTPQQIYRQPVNEYCAALFGEYNLISDLALASMIQNRNISQKPILIRPEHFIITDERNITLNGTIRSVSFHGSYSMIVVRVADQLIRVQTNKHRLATGDNIFLAVSAENIIYL